MAGSAADGATSLLCWTRGHVLDAQAGTARRAPSDAKHGMRTIDFEEFVEMMTGKMGDRDSPEEIRRVFKLFDDDETGKISFRNLKRVRVLRERRSLGQCLSRGLANPAVTSTVRQCPAEFLRASRGVHFSSTPPPTTHPAPGYQVARELGENMTDEELQEMINKADLDGDGEVSEEEFLRIMTYKHSFKAETLK
eukprot:scaffold18135_cov116-Isochrysis_galbana.AAC.6